MTEADKLCQPAIQIHIGLITQQRRRSMSDSQGQKPDRPDLWREQTVHTEPIFQGKIISLQVDTVELPDGRTATREIVRHPGASAVLALLDGKLLVVEQYRKPMDIFQIEIPA